MNRRWVGAALIGAMVLLTVSVWSRLPDQIDEETKEYRANVLMEIQRKIANEQNSRRIGSVIDVLVEQYDGRNDVYIGRSQYDAPEVDGEVYVTSPNGPLNIGELYKVRVTHAYEYDLSGEGLL